MSERGGPIDAKINAIKATNEFRALTSIKSKVLMLRFQYDITQADICRAMGLHKGTVSKWCHHPKAQEGAGRPGYLSREASDYLFGQLVRVRTDEHNPMSTDDIIHEVIDSIHEIQLKK